MSNDIGDDSRLDDDSHQGDNGRYGRDSRSNRSEYIKFGLLILILLGTLVVIALLRPLIFERIVPAVLGMGSGSDSLYLPSVTVPQGNQPGNQPQPVDTAVPGPVENIVAPTPAPPTAPPPTPTPTPVPLRQHVVRPGENLTRIASQYGVTIQAIVAANQIADPDRITAGTVLLIPDP
ncbi:MAG: LysM peptidoglycan-binding domain-containing protein [Chloroflexi bacterium]|nr:LysM peptidoglycan-binding domain-containing protein [Chloroflexota bacterium]MCI0578378.1 LysM peptidoglycan-binding domain-containing protein [Chloroflexota bacterium]MCI0645394.1 LysM peptidoglycan-binding domain-containing protein [Chloroflexota bacterium]MCI0725811.1 LysM peptidoglycan-binding domain-containing protein [Chloroflexota bacterium]